MSAVLKNDYGKIVYDDDYLATVVGLSAIECYGLAGMSEKNFGETLSGWFKTSDIKKGVSVRADGSENITIQLSITVKYGVSLSAVAENIIDKVKYSVEKDTGLNVESVDIVVQGIET